MTDIRGQGSEVSRQKSGRGLTLGRLLFALSLVGALLFPLCFSADAQQPAKVPKLGWLGERGSGSGRELFRRELGALGYVENKNITFEYRYADNKLDRLPGLADELVRLNVDLLVAPSTLTALTTKNATRTIPIVFVGVDDPVAAGLIDSLARPGGNITGFSSITAVLAGKRLELFKETVPNLSRVAVLWNPQDPSSVRQWNESQLAGRELGLQLHSMEVSGADKYENAFKEAIKARSAGFVLTLHALANSNQKQIAVLATKHRLPAIYPREDFVVSGGLMSYGPDRSEPFRRVATMVDKILKGTKPADIPVEQPTKFQFVVNLKTAKQIGLTIPPNVLVRADRVIR